jgi:hypothetical protein
MPARKSDIVQNTNVVKSDARTISDQDLSDNQSGAGFGYEFSDPVPPVRRNVHSSSSICFWKINK